MAFLTEFRKSCTWTGSRITRLCREKDQREKTIERKNKTNNASSSNTATVRVAAAATREGRTENNERKKKKVTNGRGKKYQVGQKSAKLRFLLLTFLDAAWERIRGSGGGG